MSARNGRRGRGSATFADPQMRISDADRADVADRLSKHYSDGRLDQAEFNERLDRAMKAKTQADLTGLFADLPDGEAPAPPAAQRRARPRHPVLFLILVVVIAAAVGQALAHSIVPWLLVAVLAFVW